MSDNLVKIAKLLRKAESTDNQHEAEVFLQAAQRLGTLYSIDLAVARRHTAQEERRQVPTSRQVSIGERGKKGLGTYCDLFLAIGHANNLVFDIAHNSTYVIAYGFEEDIEVTEAIYATVLPQMVKESDAYIRRGEYKGETVYRMGTVTNPWGETSRRWGKFPVSGRTARINFQEAYAQRIGERLGESQKSAQREAVEADVQGSTGTELAIRAAELEVRDFYKSNSTAKGSWKGSRAGADTPGATSAGTAAGSRARLGGASIGGSRKALV